jgi:hypothetical protein
MRTPTQSAADTQKVRRDVLGGKRGDGHKRDRRIRRPAADRIRLGKPDPSLTGAAGLVPFANYLDTELRLDVQLYDRFFDLKAGPMVIYPMEAQLRLLIDTTAVGEQRVFGLEGWAHDPLFVWLAGGVIPSVDTVYRDLARFDEDHLALAEELMAKHGLALVRKQRSGIAHLDIDTTVMPLAGSQEDAAVGYNPHYHGRPSYHPLLAVVAETGTCIGAVLRPGDAGFGGEEALVIGSYIQRLQGALGHSGVVRVRIDSGGDCAEIFAEIAQAHAFFIVKARMTRDLCSAVACSAAWRTVDWDADGKPTRQVAEIDFQRKEWALRHQRFRVIGVRSRERDSGKQLYLWPELDFTVQVFITNDPNGDADDLAYEYDGRAGIEPRIAELKYGWGTDCFSSQDFNANHALFLLKLLSHNLLRRYVAVEAPELINWRVPWLRRALLCVPGRLVRSGRTWTLRVQGNSMIYKLLN